MDEFLRAVTLLGMPALVLVPLLVEAMKALGLPVRWAGVAAMGAGLVIAALAEAVAVWPALVPFVRVALAGVLLGLASSGAYSQMKGITKARGKR
jgi:hypothetical protein